MASILANGNVIEPDSFYRTTQISYLDLFKSAANAATNCWKRAGEAESQRKKSNEKKEEGEQEETEGTENSRMDECHH